MAKLLTRITFSRPKKAKVCLYDSVGSDLLLSELKSRGITSVVLHVRGERLHLMPLLNAVFWGLFRQGKLFDLYVDSFLRLSGCQVVITTIDNDTRFWGVGARNPKITTIAIQNGIRGDRFDVFEHEPSANSWTDYLFCFSEPVGRRFNSQGNFGHTVVHGSLKSNQVAVIESAKRGVAWISQYSPDWDNPQISSEDFHEAEKRAFSVFSQWAIESGRFINVLIRSEGETADREKRWFHEISKSNELNFQTRDPRSANYGFVDSIELLGTCDSTLGYEALSRGSKVVFFSWRPQELGSLQFGWPAVFEPDGPFWIKSQGIKESLELLNKVVSIDSRSFTSEFGHIISQVMERDESNTKLFSLIDELVGPSHG